MRSLKKTWSFIFWAASALFALLSPSVSTFAAQTRDGAPWIGQVTSVVDGDSIYVRPVTGGKPISIRLHGIDAPERCQSGGEASREALSERVRGQRVRVSSKARDSYGRLVAQVFIGGDDLGQWMVERGHAWSYRYRNSGGPYALQQRQAEQAGRGLFDRKHSKPSRSGPVYPGQFRRQHGACR